MSRRPPPSAVEAMRCVKNGEYCRRLGDFDERSYLKNWHYTFFVVFGFLRRYVKLDHAAASGDLVMSMIASEIWLYNIGRRLAAHSRMPDAEELAVEEIRRQLLPKCNAYSISLALGLSPETVRRKVKKLVGMGWVERAPNGDLHITAACEAVFTPEANLETMRDFVSTARLAFRQLGIDFEAHGAPAQEPPDDAADDRPATLGRPTARPLRSGPKSPRSKP